MKGKTIDLKEVKKKYRFSIVLNWNRYQKLQLLMNALKTKQKAKAINFLLDFWYDEQELLQIMEEIENEK